MNSDTGSYFGTLIRMTGNGRARLWFVIVFLRRLSGVRLSYPTIFTREPSRRCPLLWMHWKQRGSNLSRSRNYFAWQRRNRLARRMQPKASQQVRLHPLLPLNNLLRAGRAVLNKVSLRKRRRARQSVGYFFAAPRLRSTTRCSLLLRAMTK